MAGGVFAVDRTPDATINVGGKLTLSIIITCIVAASGGLLFGYDVGISGSYISVVINELCHFVIFIRKNYC
jgi:hypothetical protein